MPDAKFKETLTVEVRTSYQFNQSIVITLQSNTDTMKTLHEKTKLWKTRLKYCIKLHARSQICKL